MPRLDDLALARPMDRYTRVEARILHLEKTRDPWRGVPLEIHVIAEAADAPPQVKIPP